VDALVTGGTGSLGRRLVRHLAERGDRVRVLVRARSRREEIASYVSSWCAGDVLDPESLRRACEGAGAVFHLAARVDFGLDDPAGMRRVNVEGTENVLEAAREADVPRVVHVSTIGAVGASPTTDPLDESFAWNLAPLRIPYFDTKHDAEECALAAACEGLDVVVVNPPLTLAPPDRKRRPRGLLARLLSGRGLPFSVHAGVNIVDQRDAAATIACAGDRGRSGERYLVTGENLTIDALLAIVARATGAPPPRLRLPHALLEAAAGAAEAASWGMGRTPRVYRSLARLARYHWYYDASKAARELGHAPRPLAQTIDDVARALRDQR